MKTLAKILFLFVVLCFAPTAWTAVPAIPPPAPLQQYIVTPLTNFDIIVAGADEPGVATAIGAAEQCGSCKILLVSTENRLGGMMGGGVSLSDINSTKSSALVPPSAIRQIYGPLASQETVDYTYQAWHRANGVARPSWYDRQIMTQVSQHPNITVLYNRALVAVEKNGLYPKALIFQNMTTGARERYTTTRAAEGGYDGDLGRLMQYTIAIGRESTALYSESAAGVTSPGAWTNSQNIDPYVTVGVPGSGLLFPLRTPTVTTVGAADGLVMQFGYRMFWTSRAGEKVAFPTPNMATYDPMKYELLGREFAQDPTFYGNATLGLTRLFQMGDLSFNGGTAMGNGSGSGSTYLLDVDVNSLGPLSSNYPNTDENLEYVTASPERRAVIRENAKQYTLGLLYFINTDSRTPAALKTAINAYGFSNLEYKATGGFPPTFYRRVGARIVGDTVLKQSDITSYANGLLHPIAKAYYDIDSPIVQMFIPSGLSYPRTDGATLISLGLEAGAPIPVNILWPKAAEGAGTCHPGTPSVSDVAWRSIRMGPIEWGMGYACGVNLALSLQQNTSVQTIDLNRLDRIINFDGLYDGLIASADLADGNSTTGTPGAGTRNRAIVTTTGTAPTTGINNRPHSYGSAISWATGVTASKQINPLIKYTQDYCVYITYPSSSTAATNATVTITNNSVVTTRTVNMQYPGGLGGFEEPLGCYTFRAGPGSGNDMSPDFVTLVVSGHNGLYRYGGLKFVPVKRVAMLDRVVDAGSNTSASLVSRWALAANDNEAAVKWRVAA
jgi:hypothetical protein